MLDLATAIELGVGALTVFTIVGGGFYYTGRVTRTLEALEKISTDHEERIRDLERAE